MYVGVRIYIICVLTSVNPCAQQIEKPVHPAVLGEGTRDLYIVVYIYICIYMGAFSTKGAASLDWGRVVR